MHHVPGAVGRQVEIDIAIIGIGRVAPIIPTADGSHGVEQADKVDGHRA
jgi:hypothetical protein